MSDWLNGLEAEFSKTSKLPPKGSFTARDVAMKLNISFREARERCLGSFERGILDRVLHRPIGGSQLTYYYFDKKPSKSKT
jgi:hypothetical protein